MKFAMQQDKSGDATLVARTFDVIGPMTLRVRKYDFAAHLYLYRLREDGSRFWVLEKGECKGRDWLLVRAESACQFAHLFHSAWCDCEQQFEQALEAISREDDGLLIYALDEDGRGIGLENHVRAYMKQDGGYSSTAANEALGLPPDQRDFSKCARIVSMYRLRSIRLLTNNPARTESFTKLGIDVEVVPHISNVIDEWNIGQLADKQYRLHHLLPFDVHRFWLQAAHNSDPLDWIITSGGRKAAAGRRWENLYHQLVTAPVIGHEVTLYLICLRQTCPALPAIEKVIVESRMTVVVGGVHTSDWSWREFIERLKRNGVEIIVVTMQPSDL